MYESVRNYLKLLQEGHMLPCYLLIILLFPCSFEKIFMFALAYSLLFKSPCFSKEDYLKFVEKKYICMLLQGRCGNNKCKLGGNFSYLHWISSC